MVSHLTCALKLLQVCVGTAQQRDEQTKARFKDEQIIAIIEEQEAGEQFADPCRRHGISSATLYKYKSKYRGYGAV